MKINLLKYSIILFHYLKSGESMCNKIITNGDLPSCRNCIYFKPTIYDEFTSSLSRCEKFGKKDILTDKINYVFADLCRQDENKCGKTGKYFKQEENIDLKIFKYNLIKFLPIFLVGSYIVLTF